MIQKVLLVCSLIASLSYSSLQAQEAVTVEFKQPINERIAQFFGATAKKDWLGVLNLTYDSLFLLVPKDQMLALFEQMEAEGMEITMGKFEVKDFVGQVDADNQHFVNIGYEMEMGLKFSGPSFEAPGVMGYMKASFETTYGAANINYNEEERSFLIKANKNLYAIAPFQSQDWKFVENNLEQQIILEQIIPEAVRKAFGN